MSTAQMEAALNAADSEWDWPDQKPSGSGYYNSAFGGVPPPPKKLAAVPLDEDEDPSKRVTMVRNYSWSDDTDFIRVYVPVPGVVKTGVECIIGEDKVDFRAMTPDYGLFTMALRRLFDSVDVAKSSYKVLEKKEKVIIALAKYPPPGYGTDSYINFKQWYRLHHGGTDNVTMCEALEDARLKRATQMNNSVPKPPKPPDVKRR